MAERYATVVTQDDGTEIVSNIGQFEGKPADPTSKNAKRIKVPDGVKIGMVKGGSVQALAERARRASAIAAEASSGR